MSEILAKAKTVGELLRGAKYSIDYYQREYRWGRKQIDELVTDLTTKFLDDYRPEHARKDVQRYSPYFLGSIIVSIKEGAKSLVDGQQRLTSLTLLLIFLRTLQAGRPDAVHVDDLIYSEKYGEKSFNIDVPERTDCLTALFEGKPYDPSDQGDSNRNIYDRFTDIEELFPDELREEALPYFVDWLLERVVFVEITAYSDEDAYTIFETMNDRGLSLTPTEMLKGYLLANVEESERRKLNQFWTKKVQRLVSYGRDTDPDFFKSWLRAQHAETARGRAKGAVPEDFERIGTEYHRWVRDRSERLGLTGRQAFSKFVREDFDFYSDHYELILRASQGEEEDLPYIQYVADHGFTLQPMVLLAPLSKDDSHDTVLRKLRVTSRYLDILLAWRLWNYRYIYYNNMWPPMFSLIKEIRRLPLSDLAQTLHRKLLDEPENFDRLSPYHTDPAHGWSRHIQNSSAVHRFLARITDYVEVGSGLPSRYREYVHDKGENRYEIEHVWPNQPDRFRHLFTHHADFSRHRERVGGLLLVRKKLNASIGDRPFEEKRKHYLKENLLAASLHPDCYNHNPGFVRFVKDSGLPFKPYDSFELNELDERTDLYRRLAKMVWDPDDLLREGQAE